MLTIIRDILMNPVFYPVAITAITSQIIKFLIISFKRRRFLYKVLWYSGGMPSSHSSVVMSLTTVVALNHPRGVNSLSFASTLIFALIVMYDAAGVRRSSGEHAKMLNKFVDAFDSAGDKNFSKRKHLREMPGHTPFEVLVGGVYGVFSALLVHRLLG